MDNKFERLFQSIEQFINIGRKSVAEAPIENPIADNAQVDKWSKIVESINLEYGSLRKAVDIGLKKHKQQIDVQLDNFRGLSKRLDLYDYSWSKYSKNIDSSISEISRNRSEVDITYKLGDEKYR